MFLNKLNKAIIYTTLSKVTPIPVKCVNQLLRCCKHLLFVLLLIPLGLSSITAQSCFTELANFSGFDTSPYQDSLNAWACQVKEVLPAEFQDDFQVFDFGFYTHTESYEGEFPEMFDKAIAAAEEESPYYLLIGKQSDSKGIYTKFWVDVNLPKVNSLPCLTSEKEDIAKQLVKLKIEETYSSHDNSPYHYDKVEQAAMEEFRRYINKLINCCDYSEAEKLIVSGCELGCFYTEDKMSGYLKSKGFIEYEGASFTVDEQMIDGQISYNLSMTTTDGFAFALTDETNDFLALPGINGEFRTHYFDEETCDDFESFLNPIESMYGDGGTVYLDGTDYEEDLVILNFGGQIRVLYRFTTVSESVENNLDGSLVVWEEYKSNTSINAENSVVVPYIVGWLLKKSAAAGIGVGLHVGMTVAIEKWFNEENDGWIDAWNNVSFNWWDLVKAGAEGALGIESVLASGAFGFATGGIEYLLNTPTSNLSLEGFFSNAFTEGLKGLLIGLGVNLGFKIVKHCFAGIRKYYNKVDEFISENGNQIPYDLFILFKDFIRNPKLVKMWENTLLASNFNWNNLINDPNTLYIYANDILPQAISNGTANIALGISDVVGHFAVGIKGIHFHNWHSVFNTNPNIFNMSTYPDVFNNAINACISSGKKIYFNVDGIIDNPSIITAINNDIPPLIDGQITNWELATIMRNIDLFANTIFYRNGDVISLTELLEAGIKPI